MKKVFVIFLMVIIGLLLISSIVLFIIRGSSNNLDSSLTNNCIKIQTTCCPCNMGGEEICVLESEVEEYEKNLSECSEGLICAAVYSCEIKSCEYIDGECIAT